MTFAISLSSAATLSQYDSLTQAQCDNIVSKLQTSLQMVDMSVIVEVLYADKILTPEEFGKLQDRSLSGRPRWLVAALRRTGKHGLKSFHRALQKTGGATTQHREMLLVLVAKGVCVFVHAVCTCECAHVCVSNASMLACTYVCMQACKCHLLCVYVCACMYVCMHARILLSSIVCVFVCVYVCSMLVPVCMRFTIHLAMAM